LDKRSIIPPGVFSPKEKATLSAHKGIVLAFWYLAMASQGIGLGYLPVPPAVMWVMMICTAVLIVFAISNFYKWFNPNENASDPDADFHFAKGKWSFHMGNYNKAIDEFMKARDLAASHPLAQFGTGLAYFYLKDFQAARIELESFLTDFPSSSQAAQARRVLEICIKNSLSEEVDDIGAGPKCGSVLDKRSIIPPGVLSPIEKARLVANAGMVSAIAYLGVVIQSFGSGGGPVSCFPLMACAAVLTGFACFYLCQWLNRDI
jgi:hypothetical protein